MSQVTDFRSRSARGLTPLLCIVLVFGYSGCGNSEQTWYLESRSPDKKFVATARTLQPGGWGTGLPPETSVDLNLSSGSQKTTEVLHFIGDADEPASMNVKMVWQTPNYLEITYKPGRIVQFQAVKCFNVEIGVREGRGTDF